MLVAKPTKFGSGIEIFGDYHDFRELHNFLHEASENDVIPYKFQEFMLGLAYEVRKAYEGQRQVKDYGRDFPTEKFEQKILYIGFKYEWISFLVTIRILRWSAAFRPTTLLDQSLMFKLEYLTLKSLTTYSKEIGEEIWNRLIHLDIFQESYAVQWIEECSNKFLSAPNGKKRFAIIPKILFDLTVISDDYLSFYHILKQSAEAQNCSIDDLRMTEAEENSNFKW